MSLNPQKYIRKPLYVEAIQVTEQNMLEVTFWCNGTIRNNDGSETRTSDRLQPDPTKQHIYVKVRNPNTDRQTQAHVGDWVTFVRRGGYKVYSNGGFKSAFELVETDKKVELDEAAVRRWVQSGEFQAIINDLDDDVKGKVREMLFGTMREPSGEVVFSQGGGGGVDLRSDVLSVQSGDDDAGSPATPPQPHEPTPSEPVTENPYYGHCDTCGALCDEGGCTTDRGHLAAIPG